MNYIYLVFVRPIELLLGLLFDLYHRASGDYGISLFLLSASVTLLTAPLYYLAEKWKREEEEIAYRMRRDVACVKRNFKGQKRFYLLRNAHRLYGYSPLLQLKASFGLLIQIPFFFAAYEMLSSHGGLRGHAFLFIADLGKADALLRGINLLPFAMTAVNLLSTLAYTKSFSLRKNSTMLIMALAFLVLLYDRPAALLVYWTMNNVFSLGKNLLFPAKKAEVPEDIEAEPGMVAKGLARLRELYDGSLFRPALALGFLSLFASQSWWLSYRATSYERCYVAAAALALALSLAAAVRCFAALGPRRAIAKLLPMAAVWALFAASAYVLYFERRQNAFISNRNIKILSTMIADLAAWLAALLLGPGLRERGAGGSGAGRGAKAEGWGLYAACFGYAAATLFLLSPLRVYFSSPQDMGVGPLALALGNLPSMVAFLAIGCLPPLATLAVRGRFSGRAAKELALAVMIAGLVFSLISGSSYGILDEFELEKSFLLKKPPLWQYAADIAILLAALTAARVVGRRYRKGAFLALAALAALSVVQTASAALRADPAELAAAQAAGAEGDGGSVASPVGPDFQRFSKTGRNLVFIVADMCNGNYLERAIGEDPGRARKLEGFTYWPDTLAAGSITAVSIPSIYAGKDFEPQRFNEMPGTGKDKVGRAAGIFFGGLLDRGFSVSAVDPVYTDLEAMFAGRDLRVSRSERYVGLWKQQRGSTGRAVSRGSKNALLTMLGAFGAAPYSLKAWIYDNGSWIVFRQSYQFDYIAKKTRENYAYIDLLPELSSSSAGAPDRAIFIHTQLTHEPFGIGEDGAIIRRAFPDPKTKSFVDGRSAYLTARYFFDALGRWTDWMKREGVYDNTLILVLSDHGNKGEDQGFKPPRELTGPEDRNSLSRSRSLLIYKPFGARTPLKVDPELRSTEDAGSILGRGLQGAAGAGPDPSPAPGGKDRVREYRVLRGKWAEFLASESMGFTTFRVRGRIDDPAAWSKE